MLFVRFCFIMMVNFRVGVYILGEVIAFVSGKGGTGKSALCAALSCALAQSGRKVLAIDGDVGLRNLDIFLGLAQSDALSFGDICSGYYPFSAALTHPQYPDLSFLTAPANGSFLDLPREKLMQMVENARWQYDFVLLDCPSGIAQGVATLAQSADRCILVTTADPAAIRCAERTGQELEKLGCREVRLLLNRLQQAHLKAMHMTIDDVMDTVGLPLLGFVPEDENLSLAAVKGKPYLKYSRKGAAVACLRITKRIQGLPSPIAVR